MTEFIKHCYKEVFDTMLLNKLSNIKNITQTDIQMELGYFSKDVLKIADFKEDIITVHQFQIVKAINVDDGAWTMTFDFIKTKSGYKFFECDSYGGPICCR